MNIYGFGNALIDIEFLISEEELKEIDIPKGGMKNISSEKKEYLVSKFKDKEVSRTAGGSTANSLCAAIYHGATGNFSCSIGQDEDGKEFLRSLSGLKIFTKRSPKPTGTCLIFLTPDGERTMTSSLEANLDLSPKSLSKTNLKESNLLLFDSFSIESDSGFNTAMESIKIAKKNKVEICYGIADVSLVSLNFKKISWILSQKIDYIYGNKQEIQEVRSLFNLQDLNIITTFGSDGASIGNIRVDTESIDPISTNGAGDAFIGAFIALKDKHNHKEALQIAVNYATELCKINGPRIKNAT